MKHASHHCDRLQRNIDVVPPTVSHRGPPRIPNYLPFSIPPPFWAILSIFFINFGCQVVLYVSHISNLVLHHWKR